MMLKRRLKAVYLLVFVLWISACTEPKETDVDAPVPISSKEEQDKIIKEHMGMASQYDLYSREREEQIDKGLAKDSTIAYLWQQKAMPLFKQGKYELGMRSVDRAVRYDRKQWQPYRAFIKCIFSKTYQEAIDDFEDCKVRFGDDFEQDHSYDFYIALSKLQLNEFETAEQILKKDIEVLVKNGQEDLVHHLDLFYYGISKYEQKKYEEAIEVFDWALKKYDKFSDVQYYKGLSLRELERNDEARAALNEAKSNAKKGYTINEDNAIYERYPYQVRWD